MITNFYISKLLTKPHSVKAILTPTGLVNSITFESINIVAAIINVDIAKNNIQLGINDTDFERLSNYINDWNRDIDCSSEQTTYLKDVSLSEHNIELESKDKDLLFDVFVSLGSKCAYRYINGLSTWDLSTCREMLNIKPSSVQDFGFKEGWVKAH